MSNSTGTGHPVLGVVLGILGILAALLLATILGVIGGGIALILGVIAVLIGISARKKGGKGIGAIVVGALAIVLAVVLTLGSITAMKEMKTTAESKGLDIAKYMDNPYFGVIGIFNALPKDEASLQQLIDQLNELQGNTGN